MEIVYETGDFSNPGDRDLYNGIWEINRRNYKNALKHFEKAISYDSEYALLFAGIIYLSGFGLENRDPLRAVTLFKQAAGQFQNNAAYYLVGIIYFEGDIGIPQATSYGLSWMMVAAKRGWYDAMANIGLAYCTGESTELDFNRAIFWLQKVAENDDNDSGLINDGQIYLFGNKSFKLNMTRVRKDIIDTIRTDRNVALISPVRCLNGKTSPNMSNWDGIKHIMIWDLMTNKKSSSVTVCEKVLATIYSDERKYTPPDYDKAVYWAKKAAKNGSATGYLIVGLDYERGTSVKQDYQEAMKWFKKSHEIGGETEAIFRIGNLHYLGLGVKRDCRMALFYFEDMASKTNDGNAYYLMGEIFRYGKDGVPQDEEKAYECYLKAAENGFSTAATEIGMRYKEGLSVKKDQEKAHEWFMKGALMGCPLAQYGLGTIYFEGYRGKVDLDKAMHWFKLSDTGGFELARFMMTEVDTINQQ